MMVYETSYFESFLHYCNTILINAIIYLYQGDHMCMHFSHPKFKLGGVCGLLTSRSPLISATRV